MELEFTVRHCLLMKVNYGVIIFKRIYSIFVVFIPKSISIQNYYNMKELPTIRKPTK